MATIGEIYREIESFAPFAKQEEWDNSGLLVGGPEQRVTRVVLALDATPAVVEDAIQCGAQLVITHHPLIFEGLKKIHTKSQAYQLIQNGIGLISAHTNLDFAEGGVNDQLARVLGLGKLTYLEKTFKEYYYKVAVIVPEERAEDVAMAMAEAGAGRLRNYSHCSFSSPGIGRFKPLTGDNPYAGEPEDIEEARECRVEMMVPPKNLKGVIAAMRRTHPYDEIIYDIFEDRAVEAITSLGRSGYLEEPMEPEAFARHVKERLNTSGLRFVDGGKPVRKVAVCGGAGGHLLELAIKSGADAFVTGEVKHHQYLDAATTGITVVDAGHFATENVMLAPLRQHLEIRFPTVEFIISEENREVAVYL